MMIEELSENTHNILTKLTSWNKQGLCLLKMICLDNAQFELNLNVDTDI